MIDDSMLRELTIRGWRNFIINSVKSFDLETVNLIARHCNNAEVAKDILRKKGYGVTGQDIVSTVEEVPVLED